MCHKFYLSMLLLFSLTVFPFYPSLANNAYTRGCESYKRGDYRTALGLFLQAAATYPKSAVVHYQLANTYLQLHNRSQAKEAYSRCLSNNPDVKTVEYCRKMIDFLSGTRINQTAQGPKSGDKKPFESQAPAESYQDKARRELDERKAQFMEKAEEKAKTIRDEADRQIKEMNQNTNQLVRDPQTGDLSPGISSREADQIKGEAEAQAKKIIDQAQDRVNHMH